MHFFWPLIFPTLKSFADWYSGTSSHWLYSNVLSPSIIVYILSVVIQTLFLTNSWSNHFYQGSKNNFYQITYSRQKSRVIDYFSLLYIFQELIRNFNISSVSLQLSKNITLFTSRKWLWRLPRSFNKGIFPNTIILLEHDAIILFVADFLNFPSTVCNTSVYPTESPSQWCQLWCEWIGAENVCWCKPWLAPQLCMWAQQWMCDASDSRSS